MVWGAISGLGPGPLYFVKGTMNQYQYLNVLQNTFLPFLSENRIPVSSYTFMQDGAPCHTAKSVKKFLQTSNIQLLPWPASSPDLNPIENVWSLLKLRVYALKNPTVSALIENIKKVWFDNPEITKCIAQCIDSMPRRIESVIRAKGGTTKY
jgi:hypothetical protein